MQSIISKSNLTVKIDGFPITFHYNTIVGDKTIYVDADTAKNITKKSIEQAPIIDVELILGNNTYHKKAYTLEDVIEHMKPKPLKYLAIRGFEMVLDEDRFEDLEEKPKLSEFDQAILKAMKYNPKDKE